MRRILALVLVAIAFSLACGRYGPPTRSGREAAPPVAATNSCPTQTCDDPEKSEDPQ